MLGRVKNNIYDVQQNKGAKFYLDFSMFCARGMAVTGLGKLTKNFRCVSGSPRDAKPGYAEFYI